MNGAGERLDFRAYAEQYIVPKAKGAAKAPILLLSCMDFRYPRPVIDAMDELGLRGKYDHLILAGAGYGVVHKKEWETTFLDQLGFAIAEHGVTDVYILEHRSCGAYEKYLGVTPDDPAKEKASHEEQSQKAIEVIVKQFPKLAGHMNVILLPIEGLEKLPGG